MLISVAPHLHDVHMESHIDRFYNDFHRCGWLVQRGAATRCPGNDNDSHLLLPSDFGHIPTYIRITQAEVL